jgi:hypothetical protein
VTTLDQSAGEPEDLLIQARLEAAFDRFNRAVISGMEPTPALFLDALQAEGLELSLAAPVAARDTLPVEGPVRAGRAPWTARARDLVPRRARGAS